MPHGFTSSSRKRRTATSPTFTKKGLAFVYQQYETAPYAAGMVCFDIPYQQVLPLLTPDAAELVETEQ